MGSPMIGSSVVRGDDHPPLVDFTIGQALKAVISRAADHPALISSHQNVRLSYGELGRLASGLAAGLVALGLSKGDRVGIWAPNCVEWTLTQFATSFAGIILVNINPACRLSELEYTLRKVGAKALICADRFKSSDYVAMMEELVPEIANSTPAAITAPRLPALKLVAKIGGERRKGWLEFADIPSRAKEEHREQLERTEATLSSRDPINIQFTSGTTGLPKGATLSHHNILNNARYCGMNMNLGPADRLCIPVPLYHCFGMVLGNLTCVAYGATMIYPAPSFDAEAVLRAVECEKCTALYGVPTMFIAELEHPDFKQFDLSTLRTGVMAGAPCPIEIMRRVIDHMHMKGVTIAYGMTETSPISFQTAPDDTLERRVSTVGRVQPNLEVKIADSNGKPLPRGQRGELCTRGYAVMLGYWDDAEKTSEAIDADGWMHTGDLAVIDAEGYCNIVGRIKDMVIRGGENIYPREVEEFLFRHPKVEDVQVVGVPDAKYGEELCAWIKLRTGETSTPEEISAFCRGQIAHFKIPRHIRFVDDFPMTVTGKIQKFKIREEMMKELDLKEVETA